MARKKISQADARRYRQERDAAREELARFTRRATGTYSGTDLQTLVAIQ